MSVPDTPGIDDELHRLVDRADLDGLVRMIDSRCSTRDWEGLRRLRDLTRTHSGRQLWPAASLAEYRLALLAPAEWAAGVLDEGSGYFTIGPLTEVAAAGHTFAELRPHLDMGPRAAFVAHERVVRGEDVDHDGLVDVLDIPFVLQAWEPEYALAEYTSSGADFPAPPLIVPTDTVDAASAAGPAASDAAEIVLAVRQLVESWTASSTGRAEIVAVEGDVSNAVAALGLPSIRAAAIDPPDALAWLGWAGASGGAHGRRRGAALGRFGAWWTLAALAGLGEEWPVEPEQLGEAADELRWWWWDDGSPATGWTLRLLMEDPDAEVAVAINATDATL